MTAGYRIELFDKKRHDIANFNCGVKELDAYLKERAGQEVRKKVAAVYIIRKKKLKQIAGYYTLSSYSIGLSKLPQKVTKKLPKYPVLPATLIGRLAVDKIAQGQNIGKYLLIDALVRSYELSKRIGSIAVIVDAKNEKARTFYENYGFIQFPKYPLKLYLPINIIKNLFLEYSKFKEV